MSHKELFENACKNGKLGEAKKILKDAKSIDVSDSLFLLCCSYGHLKIVKFLLLLNPNIIVDKQPFILACKYNHIKVAEWLVNLSPKYYDEEDFNEFCRSKNTLIVMELMDDHKKCILEF